MIFLGIGDYTAKGGIEKVTIDLANALAKETNVFILSLTKKNKDPLVKLDSRVKVISLGNRISLHNRKGGIVGLLNDIYFILSNLLPIRKLYKLHKVKYVTGTDIKLSFLLYLASLGTETKVIATDHFAFDVPNVILKKLRAFYYKRLYKVIVLTDEEIKKYNEITSNIKVIPNIISYKPIEKTCFSQKRIISAGRLSLEKGFDLLIDSWEKLEKKFPGWSLDIYGEGPEKDNLQKKIDSLNLKNVTLKGFSNNISEEYLKSSIFVLSSRYEALPTVLLEALSHGVPCVSFDCLTGPKTIIKDGVNGLLAESNNIDDLSLKLEKIIRDEALLKKLTQGTSININNFSKKNIVNKWKMILK